MSSGPLHIRMKRFFNPEDPVLSVATKGEDVFSVTESTSMGELLSTMLNRGIRRIPVTRNYYGDLKGVISTTDMLDYLGAGPKYRLCEKKGMECLEVPAGKIMETFVYSADVRSSIADVVKLIKQYRIGGMPIVDKGRLVGYVSEHDITKNMKGGIKIKIKDAMIKRLFMVKECHSVFDVAKMMVHGPYRRLPVVKDKILVGIVTPYDILKFLNDKRNLRGLKNFKTSISKVMNTNIVYVKKDQRLDKAVEIMNTHHVGGLPVVEGDEMDIVGMITENDIVEFLR